MKGLEPSRPEALAPKASVSTNSTTSANYRDSITKNILQIKGYTSPVMLVLS